MSGEEEKKSTEGQPSGTPSGPTQLAPNSQPSAPAPQQPSIPQPAAPTQALGPVANTTTNGATAIRRPDEVARDLELTKIQELLNLSTNFSQDVAVLTAANINVQQPLKDVPSDVLFRLTFFPVLRQIVDQAMAQYRSVTATGHGVARAFSQSGIGGPFPINKKQRTASLASSAITTAGLAGQGQSNVGAGVAMAQSQANTSAAAPSLVQPTQTIAATPAVASTPASVGATGAGFQAPMSFHHAYHYPALGQPGQFSIPTHQLYVAGRQPSTQFHQWPQQQFVHPTSVQQPASGQPTNVQQPVQPTSAHHFAQPTSVQQLVQPSSVQHPVQRTSVQQQPYGAGQQIRLTSAARPPIVSYAPQQAQAQAQAQGQAQTQHQTQHQTPTQPIPQPTNVTYPPLAAVPTPTDASQLAMLTAYQSSQAAAKTPQEGVATLIYQGKGFAWRALIILVGAAVPSAAGMRLEKVFQSGHKDEKKLNVGLFKDLLSAAAAEFVARRTASFIAQLGSPQEALLAALLGSEAQFARDLIKLPYSYTPISILAYADAAVEWVYADENRQRDFANIPSTISIHNLRPLSAEKASQPAAYAYHTSSTGNTRGRSSYRGKSQGYYQACFGWNDGTCIEVVQRGQRCTKGYFHVCSGCGGSGHKKNACVNKKN